MSNKLDPEQYKKRADKVLLSRGKKDSPGTHIDAKGKTTEEVFQILMQLQTEVKKQM
jgi:hypothetical protein